MFRGSGRMRGFMRNMDFWMLALTMAAALFGIIMISSAGGENSLRYVIVQSAALVLGVAGICAFMVLDYEYLSQISTYLSVACVALLMLVLIPGIGSEENGARSWFVLGPVSLQPAEIAKIIFIIGFAKQLSENDVMINDFKTLLRLLGYAAVPIALILLQPDFGSASVFMFICVVMLFAAGIGIKYIISGA